MAQSGSVLKLQPTIITQKEHAERRARIMANFGRRDLIFIKGNSETERNPDVPNDFHQESHFRYLTGINLPDVTALLVPGENKYILFADRQTLDVKVWDGEMPTHQDLKQFYGADEVHEHSELRKIALKYGPKAIHTIHAKAPFSVPGAKKVVDAELAGALIESRLIKSEDEVKVIEKAIEITAFGYDVAIKATAGTWDSINRTKEHQIQAILEWAYKHEGAGLAFPSITTMDGNVLHNFELRRQFFDTTLQNGRLLLIDSGAEVEGYSGDITRTIPINGKYTMEQAQIYDIVLRAKKAATAALKVGVNFKDIHLISERVIAEGLLEIGILKGSLDDILAKGAHRPFIAHGLGHFLGLDDHDCGEYKDRVAGYNEQNPREKDFAIKSLRVARPLVEGHVVTQEPGIYFIEAVLNDPTVRSKYAGLIDFDKAMKYMVAVSGIRIEDDVLITKEGHRVLGPYIPKERHEIEELMRK